VLVAFAAIAVAALLLFVIVRASGARRQQAPTGREEMAISLLPRSSLGKWSVGLAIAFFVALVAVTGLLLGDDLLDAESNQALALILKIILIGMSGTSFVAGLISLIKRKELSFLVLVGMLITLWLGLISMVGHLFME
ncbi:MAG: hypothetical protein JW753_04880, partial [Dehalococcoidia bacterium]|nr:hypothetical protein [Dehalococcoidia bacterium]